MPEALLASGAAKVYAAARDPSAILDARLSPICLDVTSPTDISAAAKACPDVNLLINNAGVMLKMPMLAEGSEDALRREMEVNIYGVLAMVRAFADPGTQRRRCDRQYAVGGQLVRQSLQRHLLAELPEHAALAVTDAVRIRV